MMTLPGMLITDWYAAGIGHVYGLEGTTAVEDHMQATMWGIAGFGIASMAGFLIGTPLSTIALCGPVWCAGGPSPAVIVPLVALFVEPGRGLGRR